MQDKFLNSCPISPVQGCISAVEILHGRGNTHMSTTEARAIVNLHCEGLYIGAEVESYP